MKKLNIDRVKSVISEHTPEILTGIGIAGMVTTTVLAVKATPKAIRLIEAAEVQKSLDLGHGSESTFGQLTPVEIVQTTWKCYIPAVATGIFSVSCLIGASSVNYRRNAALATAYKISETALTEYRSKVIETVGEKKDQQIREEINKDRIEKNPLNKSEVIITGNGDTLCLDSTFGRYFDSSIDKINKSVNKINKRIIDEMYISLNEFYDELGLDHIPVGYELGWTVDNLLDISYSSHLVNDKPCIVMNYEVAPKYGFDKLI